MTLIARLGLRSIDVARLELRDVDWRSGELVLRGKGRREGRLGDQAVAAAMKYRIVHHAVSLPSEEQTTGCEGQASTASHASEPPSYNQRHRLRTVHFSTVESDQFSSVAVGRDIGPH